MKKGKRIEAEFLLPEVIIQHIHSFLCGKEAARSTILSKSWYKAWLTRPNLDFDQYDVAITNTESHNEFWNLVNKTVQRYEQLNLKIDSFRLQMDNSCHNNAEQRDIYSLANQVIVKALKMGALDLDFVIFRPNRPFVLSNEVLESENLVRLSLSECTIELGADGKVGCSRLESLSLCNVNLEASVIWDIICSCCPLIQKLSLCRCKFLLETTWTIEVALNPLFAKGKPVDSCELSKLKYLLLDGIEVHTSFFHDFSTKFPCVKELSVLQCWGFEAIQICGPSLECINFIHHHQHRIPCVRFDVPNLRKFTFSGSDSPSFSFKTEGSNWESDISIMCCSCPCAGWFIYLNFFLTMLKWSDSKISLSIQILPMTTFDDVEKLRGLPKPLVENLNLNICVPSSNGPALLDIIFCFCRPVFITQSWLPEWSRGAKSNNDFVEIVYRRLMQQVSNQSNAGPCDVVEVSVELFDEAVSVWRPVPWESLQDASISTYQEAENRIRFHLIWGFI